MWLSDLVCLGPLARGVVLEHHAGRVERDDRVEVVRVPGVVVALDHLLQRGGGVAVGHPSSISADELCRKPVASGRPRGVLDVDHVEVIDALELDELRRAVPARQ